ncbi:hypothetical protein GALMADRAFT_257337 [Galerina marginata CBS 339.88]|uniref:F-box domain-containing protein n=1 Tax=Galerina marginata (strain CBS 339.88) TaxID=685588 RepID=A0A067SMU9_GALM3|nr:hypothetical protein GALMADRAFT_257337 [Galerina marginata CBS 339.88]
MWSTIHLHVIQKPQRQLAIDIIGRDQGGDVTVIGDWDKYRANKVSKWLQLSGTLPISISIVRGVNSAGVLAPRASIETQLAAVVPFASRCRNLFFQGPPESLSRLASINALELSSLESLFLYAPFEGQGTRPPTHINLTDTWGCSGLLGAPSLRKLSLRHRNIRFELLNVHWSQITHLELGGSYQGVNPHLLQVSAAKLSDVLQWCERLVYLKLDLEVADDIYDTNIPSIPLLHLRCLSIRTPSDLAPIIGKLEIPAVKELTFHSTAKNANHPQCLMMLIQAGAIVKLDLDTRNVPHASFLQCLRQCRALISLTLRCARNSMERSRTPGDLIHSSRVDDEFLDLISTTGTDAFSPLLEEFICNFLTEFTTVGLTKFITRKQGGNVPGLARLKTLTLLNVPLHKRREVQQWASSLQVRAYVDAGLAVYLDGHNEDKSYQPTEEEDRYSIIDFGRSSMQYARSWMED